MNSLPSAGLHGILPFTVPNNRCSVQKYEDPSLRPARKKYSMRDRHRRNSEWIRHAPVEGACHLVIAHLRHDRNRTIHSY